MAIIVEHEKRRKEILQKSLDVFVEEGYEDVTYQKNCRPLWHYSHYLVHLL